MNAPNRNKHVIVSRHPAAIEFIRRCGGVPDDAPVFTEATADDVRGAIVYGNVPLHLAAESFCVVAVEFEGKAPRGAEYTYEDMVNAGAYLNIYRVFTMEALEDYCTIRGGDIP